MIFMVKLLPKVWNVSPSASDHALESKWNLLCSSNTILALGKVWGLNKTHYWVNKLICVYFMGFSPYVLVRGGQMPTVSQASRIAVLKCIQPHQNSELSIGRLLTWMKSLEKSGLR